MNYNHFFKSSASFASQTLNYTKRGFPSDGDTLLRDRLDAKNAQPKTAMQLFGFNSHASNQPMSRLAQVMKKMRSLCLSMRRKCLNRSEQSCFGHLVSQPGYDCLNGTTQDFLKVLDSRSSSH